MRAICVLTFLAAACATSHSTPAASGGATSVSTGGTPAPMMRVSISAGDPFSPETGIAAAKAFVPDVAAADSAGECSLHKFPGSTSTIATASFPSRQAPLMSVSMTFDASGRAVRYAETRGLPNTRGTTMAGMSEARRDSVLRAARAAVRSTVISLDYALDQGILHNLGGGKPEHAVLTSTRMVESLTALGVKDRMAHFRKLCGV